jgi:2'-5' RNA ligase
MAGMLARTFIALLPDAVGRDALAALQAAARTMTDAPRARWTLAADLHLTLRFLGDCTPATLDAALASVPLRAGELPLRLPFIGLEAWPAARPRLLVARFGTDPGLAAWVDAVERWAVAAGHEPERRDYVPHVTLARASRPWSSLPTTAAILSEINFDTLAALRRGDAGAVPRYALHARAVVTES